MQVSGTGDSKSLSSRAGVGRDVYPLARGSALRSIGTAFLAGLCALLAAWGLGALWAGILILPVIAGLAYRRHAKIRVELERTQALQAELSIYRVAETIARTDREEDLIRDALDAIAQGTGIAHWAMYLHRGGRGEFALAATRGLPEEADAELAPGPVGPDSPSPASRAAWIGETQIAGDASTVPEWSFPARVNGLGPRPGVISMPVADYGDLPAVLQCFLPNGTELDSRRRALLRWISAQLSSGLKRLRLERRDQLLASYMLSTGEMLFGLDLDGAITHANAAAESALGASPGVLVGSRLDQLAFSDQASHGTPLLDLSRPCGEFSGTIWFLRGDGSRFPAEVRLSPAFDRRGVLTAMVLLGRDVTERRDREREIERRTEELARLNEKLLHVNRELEEAQRTQNEFLANTSHELRTPLNAVIGYSMLLEQGANESEEEGRDFARSIRGSAEHLLGVINDLLDLAKVSAGRFELQHVSGDLRLPIQAAVESVGPLAAGKRLKLLIDLPVEPLVVALDPARMRQVMLNVLGNAVKFTDKGEVRVRAWRDPDTEEARVIFEDTGIGITREQKMRLFTKFGQAGPSYHRRHTGTGLGLSITRVLVENMGGTITVESDGANCGTQVSLAFPPPLGTLLILT